MSTIAAPESSAAHPSSEVSDAGSPPATGNALLCLLAGVLSAIYLVLLTPAGLSLTPDTVAYVGAAHNIVDGRGITVPFVNRDVSVAPVEAVSFDGAAPLFHFSPLLPVVLAAPLAVGVSANDAGRILNIACWALTSGLVAWAVLRLTRGSAVAAILAVLLLVTTREYVLAYTFLLTEPLFIASAMSALAVLARYLARPGRALAISFVALAVATSLTRSAGVAVIATGVIAILLWYPAGGNVRMRRALAIGLGSVAPVVLWLAYEARSASSGGARGLAWHPAPISALNSARVSMTLWLTSRDTGRTTVGERLLLVLALAVLAIAIVYWFRGQRRDPQPDSSIDRNLVRVGLLFVTSYLLVLYAIRAVLDASVPLHARLITPLLPVVWVLIVAMSWNLARAPWSRRWIGVVTLIGIVALAVPIAVWHERGARATFHAARLGGGALVKFNRRLPSGAMIEAMRQLPDRAVVFSDVPDIAYQGTDRFAIMIPQPVSRFTGSADPRYESDIADIGRVLCRRSGVVALFAPLARQGTAAFLAYRTELERLGRLRLVQSFDEGVFLGVDPAQCARARSG